MAFISCPFLAHSVASSSDSSELLGEAGGLHLVGLRMRLAASMALARRVAFDSSVSARPISDTRRYVVSTPYADVFPSFPPSSHVTQSRTTDRTRENPRVREGERVSEHRG
eukprot:scaffold776_cov347-Pavlova_lutheri.AAC.129